jgi:hypothetical protein
VNRARAAFLVARAGVDLAARVLPSPDDRARYRAEFGAELQELSPAGQLRYAAGVLSQVVALRTVLVHASSPLAEQAVPRSTQRVQSLGRDEEDAVTLPTPPVPFWRCRVLRLHRWVRRITEDGGRYEACALCGVDRGPAGYGPMTTPPWPGSR